MPWHKRYQRAANYRSRDRSPITLLLNWHLAAPSKLAPAPVEPVPLTRLVSEFANSAPIRDALN